jgi:hypothetical protein
MGATVVMAAAGVTAAAMVAAGAAALAAANNQRYLFRSIKSQYLYWLFCFRNKLKPTLQYPPLSHTNRQAQYIADIKKPA